MKGQLRCLVIQLARLGDTLQCLMALRAAKQLYPQLEICFVVHENFSDAAKRISWIDQVFTLPTEKIAGPVLSKEKSEIQALGELAQWIAPLLRKPWDFIVNWSYSNSSSYLAGLLPGRVKLGYTRNRDASLSSADGWSHFIQAVVQGNVSQNIHLTDILTTQLLTALQIHIGEPLTDGNTPATSKGFFSLSKNDADLFKSYSDTSKKWIGIQIGAGRNNKIWDPKRWAQLAQYILTRHPDCGIFVLGEKADLKREKAFFEAISSSTQKPNSLISLVGKTNFDHWASVISRCQWLFAGDTATLHLASVLGTRILNISIGGSKFNESGPYGNGHYVLTHDLDCVPCINSVSYQPHTCGESISAEAAYAVWSYATNEWAHRRQLSLEKRFIQLGWGDHLRYVRVYRTRIRNSQDGGGVVYDPMLKKPLLIDEWTGMVMGHIARSWYCGWVPSVGNELHRETIYPSLVKLLRELQDSSQVLSKICDKAFRTARSLSQKGRSLKSDKVMGIKDREEVLQLGRTLAELEELMERLAKTQYPLRGFSQMTQVLMHNLKGSQLSEVGQETANCYKQLHEGVLIFKEWVGFTLTLVKPVAVYPSNVTLIADHLHSPDKELSP